jgi:hypothetical protein
MVLMKTKWLVLAIIGITVISCGEGKVVGSGDDDSLGIVQDGAFPGHTRTVGQEVNCLLGNPEWSTLGEDGNRYVNLEGIIPFSIGDTETVIQFKVDEDSGRFEINALKFSGALQQQATIREFVLLLAVACG